ncbi:MAG: hypothetical protein E4H20_11710, partial [Spirochaetales bacterium]
MSEEEARAVSRSILGLKGLGDRPNHSIKLYDFRRPDKFPRDQLRTMQNIAESFARLATIRLSATLRLPCNLSLDHVDQMTYGEFMDPLASPAMLAVVSMEPLKGQVVLHVDAAGCDAMIERLFGAMPEATDKPLASGGLTDIEYSTIEKAVSALIVELGTAWNFVESLKPRFMQVETEARFCQVVPPTEMIVLTSFALNVGTVKGRLDIVYPFLVLEPIIHMLSAKYWYQLAGSSPAKDTMTIAWRAALPAQVMCDVGAVPVDVLRSLRKGSVIPVAAYGEGKAWLRLGGARVANLSVLRRDGASMAAAIDGADAAGKADREAKAADPVGRLAEELRSGLASFKDGVSGAMAQMTHRIDELKGGQDDLSDRVLYGQADASEIQRSGRPFSSMAGAPADALALFLSSERPQLTALVLSFLDDATGARVLSLLPESMQPDVARRVATMDRTSQEVLSQVERVLDKKLSAIEKDRRDTGGLAKIVGMLNLVPRATEKLVIEALDASDPELAESIKRNMFVFEDMIILDDES